MISLLTHSARNAINSASARRIGQRQRETSNRLQTRTFTVLHPGHSSMDPLDQVLRINVSTRVE